VLKHYLHLITVRGVLCKCNETEYTLNRVGTLPGPAP